MSMLNKSLNENKSVLFTILCILLQSFPSMASSSHIKHRRKLSVVTPNVSPGNRGHLPPASSLAITRIRPLDSFQQPPRKRVSLHPPLSRGNSAPTYNRAESSITPLRGASHEPSENVTLAESNAESQEREENDSLDEVIMAVDLRDKGTVGCCYYVAREEKLYLMEDVKYGGLDVIDTRTVVFVHHRLQ